MGTPAHKRNTKTFRQLSRKEGATAITAQFNNLYRQIRRFLDGRTDKGTRKDKFVDQIERFKQKVGSIQ